MTDINAYTMTGRLVREPLVQAGASGTKFTMFTLATNHRYKDRQGNQQIDTAYIPCKGFGGWAMALQGRRKGDTVLVTGRFKTEN
jgi:single-stranded DNA-binding protein